MGREGIGSGRVRRCGGIGVGFGHSERPGVTPLAEPFLWEVRLAVGNGAAGDCAGGGRREGGGVLLRRRCECSCRELLECGDDRVEASWRGDSCGGESGDAHCRGVWV